MTWAKRAVTVSTSLQQQQVVCHSMPASAGPARRASVRTCCLLRKAAPKLTSQLSLLSQRACVSTCWPVALQLHRLSPCVWSQLSAFLFSCHFISWDWEDQVCHQLSLFLSLAKLGYSSTRAPLFLHWQVKICLHCEGSAVFLKLRCWLVTCVHWNWKIWCRSHLSAAPHLRPAFAVAAPVRLWASNSSKSECSLPPRQQLSAHTCP